MFKEDAENYRSRLIEYYESCYRMKPPVPDEWGYAEETDYQEEAKEFAKAILMAAQVNGLGRCLLCQS